MKQKRKIAVCLLLVAILSGCGKKEVQTNVQESVVEETTVMQTMEPAMTDEVTTEADTTEVTAVDGIVLDAAMHSLEMQSADGVTLEFGIPDEADVSSLKNGLMIGKAVCVSYTGTITGDDTSMAEITKIADSTLVPSLKLEQLSFAAEIILAVKYKDMEGLAGLVAYPVYVGAADPEIVESKEDFLAIGIEKVITEEMIQAITGVNLFNISEAEAGIVLGEERPNIIFSGKAKECGITGMNY